MASIAAKKVGERVLESIGKGERPILGQIAREVGYSDNTADNPKLITETESYQSVVNPVLERMERERNRLLLALSEKDLTNERYRDMMEAVDKLTKNIQLLNGGATERHGLILNFDSSFNATP